MSKKQNKLSMASFSLNATFDYRAHEKDFLEAINILTNIAELNEYDSQEIVDALLCVEMHNVPCFPKNIAFAAKKTMLSNRVHSFKQLTVFVCLAFIQYAERKNITYRSAFNDFISYNIFHDLHDQYSILHTMDIRGVVTSIENRIVLRQKNSNKNKIKPNITNIEETLCSLVPDILPGEETKNTYSVKHIAQEVMDSSNESLSAIVAYLLVFSKWLANEKLAIPDLIPIIPCIELNELILPEREARASRLFQVFVYLKELYTDVPIKRLMFFIQSSFLTRFVMDSHNEKEINKANEIIDRRLEDYNQYAAEMNKKRHEREQCRTK